MTVVRTSNALTPLPLPPAPPGADAVQWRALSPGLWVGRRDGQHLAMIERGRRYTVTTGDDTTHAGYRSLRGAQAAALLLGRPATGSTAEPEPTPAMRALIAVTSIAAAVTTLLGVSALSLFHP